MASFSSAIKSPIVGFSSSTSVNKSNLYPSLVERLTLYGLLLFSHSLIASFNSLRVLNDLQFSSTSIVSSFGISSSLYSSTTLYPPANNSSNSSSEHSSQVSPPSTDTKAPFTESCFNRCCPVFLSSAWNCSGCSLYCFSANSISIALIISPILLQPCSLAKSWIPFRESPKPNSLANLFNLSNSSAVKPDSFNFLRASSNLYSVESINSYWENCSLNLWAQFLPLQYFSYTVWRSSSLIKSSFNQYSSEPTLLTLYECKLFSLQISSNNVSSRSFSLLSVSTSTIASASPSSVSSSSSTRLITKASGFSRCVTTQSAQAAMAPTLLPLKISSEDSASSIINFSNFSSSLSNKFNKSTTWIISSDTSGTSSSWIT